MPDNTIQWDKDADGIVTLTMDDPSGSTNVMNEAYIESMGKAVDRLVAEKDSITGVVVASAKKTFFAGGDVKTMIQARPEDAGDVFNTVETIKRQLRTLETLGKPVVAAINGAALGGGLEIALACHHRIAADVKGSQLGLPEVTLGLLPGGGGVTRTVRMFGIQNAFVSVLAQGTRFKPAKAKEIGLVDELVATVEELVPAAKAWIKEELKANPDGAGVQPWDKKGYKMPGGTPSSPGLAAILPSFPSNLRKQLKGAPMPAPRAILAAAVEGAQVDFDTASRIESRYFASLVTGQVAKNMMQAFFFDLQAINAGGSRPEGIGKTPIKRIGVLGAGMMGAGIAYVSAKAGYEVVLKDVSLEAAAKGKGYSEKLEAKALERGRTTQERSDALLARITPTADAADFKGVDFVIEAVFENQELKHKVFGEIEDIVEPTRSWDPTPRRCRSPVWRPASSGRKTLSGSTSSRRSTRCRWWRSSRARRLLTRPWPGCSTTPWPSARPRSWSTTAAAFSPRGSSARSSTRRWRCSVRVSSRLLSSRRGRRPGIRRRRCSCPTSSTWS